MMPEAAQQRKVVKRLMYEPLPPDFHHSYVDFLRASGLMTPDLETIAEAARRFKTIPKAKE